MMWSVVICCYNSASRINATLNSIAAQCGIDLRQLELLVVNNRCTDDTVCRVQIWANSSKVVTRIVDEPQPGHSFARRAGVLNARGKFICFLDDDNVPDPHYLARAEEIFCDERVAFCGGSSRYPDEYGELPLLGRYFSKSVAVGRQRTFASGIIRPGEFLWGAGLCVRTVDIVALYRAGFSPVLIGHVGKHFVSGDDGEIAILLQLNGKSGYYSSELKLAHRVERHRLKLGYFIKLFYGMGLAKPVLTIYGDFVRHQVRCTPLSPDPAGVRENRLADYGLFDGLRIGGLYIILGAAFYSGRAVCHFTSLPGAAIEQLNRLSRVLNLEAQSNCKI